MPGFPDKFMPFMNQPPGSLLSSRAVMTYGRAIHALRRFTQASLNKEPAWRGVPVVIITAKELTPQERDLLNGGVHMILQKGNYNREQLLNEVRKLLPDRDQVQTPPPEQSV